MDNLHTFEEASALKKIREEYERQLKMIGVEICDLPDDCMTLLNECMDLKMATKQHDLDTNDRKELSYTRKKKQIDQGLAMAKIQNKINDLEKRFDEILKLDQLLMLKSSLNKRLMSEAEIEDNKVSIDKKIEDILVRHKSFMVPKDVNIEVLISKVELPEIQKNNSKST